MTWYSKECYTFQEYGAMLLAGFVYFLVCFVCWLVGCLCCLNGSVFVWSVLVG